MRENRRLPGNRKLTAARESKGECMHSPEDQPPGWPKEVRRLVEDLHEAGFGDDVITVTGVPGGAWEVAIEGEHVRATAGFAFRNGRTRFVPGTMTIDGEPAPLARSYEDLRRIWDEHEGGSASEPAVLMEITSTDGQPVPPLVQMTAGQLKQALKSDLEVRCGLSGSHWVIGIDLGDGDGLRMIFTRHRGAWRPDPDQLLQVVVNGADRSAEAGNDITKAVELLKGASPPDSPVPGSSAVRGKSPSHRDLGVETRKRVVIRE
jgi:hypothetical protein